ncbi:response regulator [Parapedobacter sp. GCM10030251]|uniref:response regulator n=1 Tax=Parapedobacter sp. GCM10030251 TaxID=3273419 RepID=UPI00361CDCDD
MMSKLNTVIIADNYGIMRRGLIDIIRENWGHVNILEAKTFDQALLYLKKPVDLLILDINMPGCNRVTMLDMLKIQSTTKIKILMFSSDDGKIFALRYMQAGANGYLNKNSDEPEVILAIQTVMDGRRYVCKQMKDYMLNSFLANREQSTNPLYLLSAREMEVAHHLSQGKGVLEISVMLNLKMGTISTYKVRTFEKLGVRSTVELAEKLKLYAVF